MGPASIVPGSVTLHYRVDGGSFSELVMDPTDTPDEYAAEIPAQAWSSSVEYYLSAEDELGGAWTCPRSAPIWCFLFRVDEDFSDTLEQDGAWTAFAPDDNAITGTWVRADPVGTTYNGSVVQPEDDHTFNPGTDCYVTGNGTPGGTAGENDIDGGKTTLFTPVYDLRDGSNIDIFYWRWYTNNRGYNPGQDFWTVEISNDAGQTWTIVENTNVSSNAWEMVSIDLETYFPTAGFVQMRFIAEDVGGGSLVEAAVDDFVLRGDFETVAVGDETTALADVHTLGQNSPNPFRPRTEIRFHLNGEGAARLAVFDATGRLVRVLATGLRAAGHHYVSWDGYDDRGRPASAGIYLYRLETEERTLSRRMVLLK